MESWRRTWREGFAPQLSVRALVTLRHALVDDDPRLLQGATTSPPPQACVQDWPVEGACALGFCGWLGEGLETVGDVESFFAQACYEADLKLGEPAMCRHFLNWFDDTPRPDVRQELVAEVDLELSKRHVLCAECEAVSHA